MRRPVVRGTSLIASTSIALTGAVLLATQAGGQEPPAALGTGDHDVSFNRDIRPLFAARCFPCHGPDAEDREAKLRLDRADGPDGAYRKRRRTPAIQPGSLDESELWYRVTTDDEFDVMPPPDSQQEALDEGELELVRSWILQGAPYQDHWAFVAPVQPAVPKVQDESWCRQPVDRYVLRRLETAGLTPSPRADERTLIRRLTLDLTGLPPTREEIAAFLADDSPGAYEALVERLLASPRYGEHMAKYWLDLVRFADTNGVHHDHYRDLSPYRDWVIRAFNANLPYDEFVTDQLAGDLQPEPTEDQLTASGFHRLHMIIDVGTALPEESFARNVVDRVTAVGTAFLGLTVQCASCHDHKYDPLEQREFYGLSGFFNNLDAAPETGGRSGTDFTRGLQPPYIDLPSEEQTAALAQLEPELAAAKESVELAKQRVETAQEGEKEARNAELTQAQSALDAVRKRRDGVLVEVRGAMVMRERAEPRPTHVLVRGDYQTPGELVERITPAFLPALAIEPEERTRLDLARWLISPEHPLTARVAVNRFWQQLFGVGIVKTAEDFGTQGEWPSHPELLDHLALGWVDSGWDVKALMRRIVLSSTYQQTSKASPAAYAADPENRRLSRGARFRMDSEMIRDQVLATSGLLSPKMYGRSVKPPQPPGIWTAVTLPSSFPRSYTPDSGEATRRRSVYTFWKRGMPPPQMTILNAPARESCTARRERTNTPLQALLLMNESEYLAAARHLAQTVLKAEAREAQRLERIYETVTSQLPDDVERETLLEFLRETRALYTAQPELAEELCAGATLEEGRSAPELAAWTMLTSAVYNLDITKTRE